MSLQDNQYRYFKVIKDNRDIFVVKFSSNQDKISDMTKMIDDLTDRGYVLKEITESEHKNFDYSKVSRSDIGEFMSGSEYFKNGGRTFNDKELLAKYNRGESIGFTGVAHLKAKGLIKRSDGTKRKSPKYKKYDNGGEVLLAPNGKPSNLTPEQYRLVRTKAFKDWFGDWENDPINASKVVDENGEPLVVYHGTDREFFIFNRSIETSYRGKFEILVENVDVDSETFNRIEKYNEEKGGFSAFYEFWFSNINWMPNNMYQMSCFLNCKNLYIDENGRGGQGSFGNHKSDYDGISGKKITNADGQKGVDYYIVLFSNQIKLADGGNTTFDSNNPDISYNNGGNVLLAPNGNPSNLTPEQYKLVRTPEFKAWFGDWENSPKTASKVLDENGEPLVVYHATNKGNKINEFFKRNAGIHFGTKKAAKDRREQTDFEGIGYDLLEVFLNIKNPLKTNRDFNWEWEEMEFVEDFDITNDKEYNLFETYAHQLGYNIFSDNGLLTLEEFLKENNFDGIFYTNQKEDKGSTSYLVTESNQIKLADGGNTTFDSGNPDIRFTNGGNVLLAPNGKPSNLAPEQYKLVRTPEFKAWFGDWEKGIFTDYQKLVEYKHKIGTGASNVVNINYICEDIDLDKAEKIKAFHKKAFDFLYSEYENANKENYYEINFKGFITDFLNMYKPVLDLIDQLTSNEDIETTKKTLEIFQEKKFQEWVHYKNKNISKIVDENGEPLICFHGSNDKFDTFEYDYIGSANDKGYYGFGFYFTFQTESKWMKFAINEAEYYGKYVKPYFIRAINPFIFSELSMYKGVKISYTGTESLVFLSNIAERYPNLAEKITIAKKTYNRATNEYDITYVPISILPELIKKYANDLQTYETERGGQFNEKVIGGYLKSKTKEVFYDYTTSGGKKGSYIDFDYLGDVAKGLSKEEIEILLIDKAIEKYEGIEADYHPEGYMTRYREITQEIKKNHDCIMTSKTGDELVVFDNKNIKIADGTNTKFNPNSENSTLKYGGKIMKAPKYKSGGQADNYNKETYDKWKDLVNMSSTELKRFMDSEDGKEAGLSKKQADKLGIHYGRESAGWILKMKETNVKDWTSNMWDWAKRQISFISRMRGNKGKLYDESGNRTRKHTSLLIWGHNPEKYADGGNVTFIEDMNLISIELAEKMINRKINLWNDGTIVINGALYKKKYLSPFYERI